MILFGEHAVVYGHPAIAAVTDQRTLVEVDVVGKRFTVNGFKLHERHHAYLKTAVERFWHRDEAVRMQTEGGVPSASGTGSSSALTVAAVAALLRLQGSQDAAELAQAAFEVERVTQGGGSPTDTSTSVAGGGIAIAGTAPEVGDPLWSCAWEDQQWFVERVELPPLQVVVGNCGVKGRTDEQVAKVAHAIKKNVMVRDALEDVGQCARDAVPLLAAKDWESLGRLMDRAHASLHTLGVNHPAVQKLVETARGVPGVLGAKLTGAGGGGSMIALTDKPEACSQALQDAGATTYIVELGGAGVGWNEPAIAI